MYTAGTVLVNPAEITLYRNKMREGKIVYIEEQDVEQYATYFEHRHGVENALETLTNAFKAQADALERKATEEKEAAEKAAYREKVIIAAEQHGVEVGDRPLEKVVAEIKAKAKKNTGK